MNGVGSIVGGISGREGGGIGGDVGNFPKPKEGESRGRLGIADKKPEVGTTNEGPLPLWTSLRSSSKPWLIFNISLSCGVREVLGGVLLTFMKVGKTDWTGD